MWLETRGFGLHTAEVGDLLQRTTRADGSRVCYENSREADENGRRGERLSQLH